MIAESRPLSRRAAPVLLATALLLASGCEDRTVVTRVDTRFDDTAGYIVPLARGGLPVDVIGAPFAGMSAEAVIARLRLPGGWPADIRFRSSQGERGRLVLAFNPSGPPNGRALCAGARPAPLAPGDEGFVVTASFCNGDTLIATGHMEALNTRADDPEAFRRVMTSLFQQIL